MVFARAPDQAVGSPELVDGERRAAAQQAAGADEAHERARGERAAAEAEDVDLVGGLECRRVLEVLDQPVVGGADVGLEAEAEAAAGDLIERSGAEAFEIELELRDACRCRAGGPGIPRSERNGAERWSSRPGCSTCRRGRAPAVGWLSLTSLIHSERTATRIQLSNTKRAL